MESNVVWKEKPKLKNASFICGLPGIGLVGQIAVSYIIDKLSMTKATDLYSPHFYPQVITDADGRVRMIRDEFYYWKNPSGNDLIVLKGDMQPFINPQIQINFPHFQVNKDILDIVLEMGAKEVITLAGLGLNEENKSESSSNVLVAGNNSEFIEKAVDLGASVTPQGLPIIGGAGLLLGLAEIRDVPAVCLMGKTHVKIQGPDVAAAKSLVEFISRFIGFEIDMGEIEQSAEKSTKAFKNVLEKVQGQEKALKKSRELDTAYIR